MHATEICLRDVVARSLILTCGEKADQLLGALIQEGLNPQVIVASYSPDELNYARATRCFMNHHTAWKIASANDNYTIICESDFVPCRGIGSFPIFWPLEDELAYGYLYQGSPRLLALIGDVPYLRGHAAPTVAYVISPGVARILLKFYDMKCLVIVHKTTSPLKRICSGLQWAKGPMHIFRCGIMVSTEDFQIRNTAARGQGSRAGVHRADNLYGPLHFLPAYARGNRTKFALERLQARALGWARLLFGRWIVETNVYKITIIYPVKNVSHWYAACAGILSPTSEIPTRLRKK